MGKWAKKEIKSLREGKQVTFRPRGRSMAPLVFDKQKVTITPDIIPEVGDIVLCTVKGNHFLHKVLDVKPNSTQFKIGNNKGFVNGWIGYNSIHGVLTHKFPME